MRNTVPINPRRTAISNRNKKQKKAFADKLWKFINSNFAIFVFSSIVVTWVTNYISSKVQEERFAVENRKELGKYYVELEFRTLQISRIGDELALFQTVNPTLQKMPDSVFKSHNLDKFKDFSLQYEKDLKQQLNDALNGTGGYNSSNSIFRGQHMISLLIWFSFNMKSHDKFKEIEAVYALQNVPPWGSHKIDNAKIKRNIKTLLGFVIEAKKLVDSVESKQ